MATYPNETVAEAVFYWVRDMDIADGLDGLVTAKGLVRGGYDETDEYDSANA